MTNTPMSDLDPKVKELLEAARHVVDTGERNGLYRLGDAIAAFGPPKPEPVPVIPAWEEFRSLVINSGGGYGVTGGLTSTLDKSEFVHFRGGEIITKSQFLEVRALTSKAPTE